MSVSCHCDTDDYEYWYTHGDDFSVLGTTLRQRCVSCSTLIELGADCGVIKRWRDPRGDVEERIHGDEVPMANKYMCEECYGLLLSVEEAGGCVNLQPGEPLKEAVAEWRSELAAQERQNCYQ